MKKKEVKQWLRSQINSCIKIQSTYKNVFCLHYNKQYLRALKLSKITGHPVNKTDFKEGDQLFGFDPENKKFRGYSTIQNYLYEYYSKDYSERQQIIKEVINEYDEYKDYKGL